MICLSPKGQLVSRSLVAGRITLLPLRQGPVLIVFHCPWQALTTS